MEKVEKGGIDDHLSKSPFGMHLLALECLDGLNVLSNLSMNHLIIAFENS
jgi:hypothetical protein